jgi:hypothetical protein
MAPTFVSYGASVFNVTTTPKTVSVTVQNGDLLVVMSLAESAGGGAVNTAPTGGSLTYTQLATLGTTSAHARAIAWSAPATSGATFNVSAVYPLATANNWWGVAVWVWRDHNGTGTIGAPTVNSTSNLVTMTTAAANSALCVGSTDFAAADGTTRTRRTVNGSTGTEESYFRDSIHYGVYAQDYADTGAAGSISAGYSAPTAQTSAIIGVEVKAGAAPPAIPPIIVMPPRR